jgi:hypothetical protein
MFVPITATAECDIVNVAVKVGVTEEAAGVTLVTKAVDLSERKQKLDNSNCSGKSK